MFRAPAGVEPFKFHGEDYIIGFKDEQKLKNLFSQIVVKISNYGLILTGQEPLKTLAGSTTTTKDAGTITQRKLIPIHIGIKASCFPGRNDLQVPMLAKVSNITSFCNADEFTSSTFLVPSVNVFKTLATRKNLQIPAADKNTFADTLGRVQRFYRLSPIYQLVAP